jgi:hypothetical protein
MNNEIPLTARFSGPVGNSLMLHHKEPICGHVWMLAEIVHKELLSTIREAVRQRRPGWLESSPMRISNQTEEGLQTLLGLAEEHPSTASVLDECQSLADRERRFAFLYRLPDSCGFGLSIGRTLEQALNLPERPGTSEVTALLHIFMTLLDGLIDQAPECFGVRPDTFWGWIEAMLENNLTGAVVGRSLSHPLARMVWEIAKLWTVKARILAEQDTGKARWRSFCQAVMTSLRVEGKTSTLTFALTPASTDFRKSLLWDETRYTLDTSAFVPFGHRSTAMIPMRPIGVLSSPLHITSPCWMIFTTFSKIFILLGGIQ